MRTLHVGLRVSNRERSLAFYEALRYEVVGSVTGTSIGELTMLKLPEDEFVTIELVSDHPDEHGGEGPGLSHLVIKVESMDTTVAEFAASRVPADESAASEESNGPVTRWITDPDGNRIELVQWPEGHADGISAADWEDPP